MISHAEIRATEMLFQQNQKTHTHTKTSIEAKI